MTRIFLTLALTLVCSLPADAASPFRRVPPKLAPDRGYILVRIAERLPGSWGAVTLAPYDSAAEDLKERGRAAKNLVRRGEDWQVGIGPAPYLSEEGKFRTYLIGVSPGEYVIAHSGTTTYALGSYRFTVTPGRVTDMGTIYVGAENGTSPWGPLAALTSSPDILAQPYTVPDAMAVAPANASTPRPPALTAFPIVNAEYKNAPRFGNHYGLLINRVLPLVTK